MLKINKKHIRNIINNIRCGENVMLKVENKGYFVTIFRQLMLESKKKIEIKKGNERGTYYLECISESENVKFEQVKFKLPEQSYASAKEIVKRLRIKGQYAILELESEKLLEVINYCRLLDATFSFEHESYLNREKVRVTRK